MVNFMSSVLGMAMSVSLVLGAPGDKSTPLAVTSRSAGFSWGNWIEDVITNPGEGEHLSADDALEAFNAAVETRSLHENLLEKRSTCRFTNQAAARATVMCIERLATFGNTDQFIPGPSPGDNGKEICSMFSNEGSVTIRGSTLLRDGTSSKNRDVARGLGVIMDDCTRLVDGVNLVGGSGKAWGNGDFTMFVGPYFRD